MAGRGWRQSDVESLGGISVSSSLERQAMREQLDAVRSTLNTLAGPGAGIAGPASGVTAAPGTSHPPLEVVLTDIASKLGTIEGLYGSLTERLDSSERHIKNLQHFSASTIHETARLVDYVGGRATTPSRATSMAGGAGSMGLGPSVNLRGRHMAGGVPTTPTPVTGGAAGARSALHILEQGPNHMGATLQQHAAQIHKLIAGLDFLEAHIIRQDQMVESLQKQVTTGSPAGVAADGGRIPSELSVRMHDMSELLNKLRSHMYKVEKKSAGGEQALAALTARLEALAERLRAVEDRGGGEGGAGSGSAHRSSHEGDLSSTQQTLHELASAQAELRGMVLDVGRDVAQLRDQVEAQLQQADSQPQAAGVSAAEGAEMRRQLAFLMAQVPVLVAENGELKTAVASLRRRLPDLDATRDQVDSMERELAALQSAAGASGLRGPAADVVADAAEEGLRRVAAVEEQLAGLTGRVEGLVSREELQSVATAAAAAEQELAALRERRETAAERRASMPGADAAALSAEVAAAAKADLMEHVGRMRERLEVSAAAAEAAALRSKEMAEEAAAQCTEAVEAAAARLAEVEASAADMAANAEEAVRKAGTAAAASAAAALQESVLAMVAGVEQEQGALKQQLANLAAQVSEEQAAISAGLSQVQEQVAAATSAAMDAATCAQLVQQAQAEQGSRADPTEALQEVQDQLREQVGAVMEGLKGRVEAALQQVDEQLAAAAAASEAALQELRGAAADAAERGDLALASVEGLRAELILLTGQADVTSTRLEALEAAVGVDPRSSVAASPLGGEQAAGRRVSASDLEEAAAAEVEAEALAAAEEAADAGGEEEEAEEDGAEGEDGAAAGGRSAARAAPRVAAQGGGGGGGGGGLLDLVAQLRARVGGLEGAVEAAAADMDGVRGQLVASKQDAEDAIQQATSRLASEVAGLTQAVGAMDERVASAASTFDSMAAASGVLQRRAEQQAASTAALEAQLQQLKVKLEEEVVDRVQETSQALASLTSRISRDYVNREQLGAIFQARADMKRAVDELASVFDTGRLVREASSDDVAVQAPSRSGSVAARNGNGEEGAVLSPRLVQALEDLAGKQAELEQQVKLALYRSESMVRHEQLNSIQQAMVTLEMQFRRMGAAPPASPQHPAALPPLPPASTAAVAAAASAAAAAQQELAELRARVAALEAAVPSAATSGAAASPATAASHGLGQGHGAAGHHRRTASRDSAFVHLCLSPADPAAVAAGGESPLRVRLLVEAVSTQDGAGTDADMSVAEPSLSQLLVAEEAEEAEAGAGGEAEGTSLQAALAVAEEVRQLRGVLGDLTELCAGLQDQVTHAAESRKVLEETVSELQERLDSQVAATASSLALMATMATDQHDQHKQRSAARLETAARLEAAAAAGRSSRSLGLGLAVGGSEEGDDDGGEGLDTLSTLARTVNMLAARLQAAEDQLEAAFVVRTPRSPTSRAAVAAAAAAAAASAAAAAAAAAEVSGEEADVEADVEAAGAAEAGAEAAAGSGSGAAGAATSAEDDGEEEDEEGRVLGLGLMVPVVPREMERQLGALQGAVQELAAVVGRLGGRVESLEEAGALEDVRAAAAEVVLEAIPGAIAQQLESVLGRQAEQAADAARRAEAEADAARAAAAEAAAARETVEEVAVVVRGAVAVAEAAREAAAAREEAAAVALDAVESAVREAAVEAEAARNSVVDAEAARQAAQEAQAAAEAAAAVVAAAQPAAPASAGADPALAESLQAACVAAAVSAAREAAVEAAVLAARDAAAVATQRAVGAAQEAATEAIAAAAVRASSPRGRPDDAGVAAGLAAVTAEVKEVQSGLSSVTARLNDVDSLRDQLEALAEQVRYAAAVASAADANAAAAAADPSQPAPQSQAPDTPPFNSDGGSAAAATVAGMFSPSATAVIIPPSRTPRMSGAGASPMGGRAAGTAAATASQQAAFLARLVEVVKRQSGRLHAQYSDAEETGTALAAVDSRLDEAQAALAAADVRDVNSPAFAETLVTVLEQVAALRFIGSQTHPAVQQMVLHHENRLDEIAEQLKALATGLPASNGAGAAAADGGARPAADTGAATAALAEEVVGVVRRLGRLESELGTVAGHTAALDKALGSVLEAVRGLGAAPAPAPAGEEAQAEADQAAGNANANVAVAGFSSSASSVEVAALGAKVQLLEEVLESRLGGLREEVRAAIDTATGVAAGGGGGGGGGGLGMSLASASDLAALDGRVAALHTAASNMRNRLLAVQEYVDSTQGMIKDMHVAVGSLHRRIDGLEAAAAEQVGGGWGGGGAADGSGPASGRASVSGEPSSLKEVQSELLRLEHRLLAAEGSALESAHGLASLKALAPRLAEAEARLADASGKLAAALGGSGSASSGIPAPPSGVTLPSVAAGLRALERRVACRLEAGVVALEGLTGALGAASRIERESTANPFKAISAAVNNPVVAALEKKVEAVRAELAAAAGLLLDDLRRDARERPPSLDLSAHGGAGGGLTFRP